VSKRIRPCSVRGNKSNEYISLGVNADEDESMGRLLPLKGFRMMGRTLLVELVGS
jgi:hypothetical protein